MRSPGGAAQRGLLIDPVRFAHRPPITDHQKEDIEMPHVHRRHLLFAGLMIAGTGAPAATAQEAPAAPAPLAGPDPAGARRRGNAPGGSL